MKNFRVRKIFYIFGFLRLKMTSYRKTNDFFSLEGCEPFFVKISPRNSEKSKLLKKFFWTILQWHIAYVFDWEITYFCARFQRLTLHGLRDNLFRTDTPIHTTHPHLVYDSILFNNFLDNLFLHFFSVFIPSIRSKKPYFANF